MSARRLGVAAAAFGLLVAMLGPTGPAAAQVEDDGSLSITGQTTLVRPGGLFDLEMLVAGVGGRHTITVEVFPAVSSRIEFLDGLRPGADLGEPIHRREAGAIANLQPASTDLISVRVRTSRIDDARPNTAALGEGVHPVRVRLARPDGEPVDEAITHLLALPRDSTVAAPLAVAMVVPVAAPVALGAGQQLLVDPTMRAVVSSWIEALRVHDEAPVAFRLPGETVEALFRSGTDDDTAVLEALAQVATDRTFLASTFVEVDHEAWRDTTVDGYHSELRQADEAALGEHLPGAVIDGATHLVAGTDTGDTLLWLQENGIERAVVPAERLQPLDPTLFPLTVTQPFVLEHADGAIDAVAIDAILGSHLGATGSPALDAHRVLADLTLLALDDRSRRRAVVFAPPTDLVPDATMLTTLLTSIRRSPVLETTTLDTVFEDIPPANASGNGPEAQPGTFPLVRRLTAAEEAPSLGAFPAQLVAAQQDLESFETVVGENSPLSAPLHDLLLVSGAGQFDSVERAAYLDTVRVELSRSSAAVSTESEQSVSLTARQADVPVSLINELGVAARVHLVLESDKLEFPDGDRLEMLLEPGTSTVEIPVRARTSGGAVLEITPRSPDDRLRLGESTQVTVRSTVLSGLGIIISVAALAVLVTWWARQVWRRRRGVA